MNTKVMKKELQRKRKVAKIKRTIWSFILGIATLTTFTVAFAGWLEGDIPTTYDGEYSTYFVSKGERLWDIAEEVADGKDVREVVYIIEKDNNLDNANLHIGQELKLRAEY